MQQTADKGFLCGCHWLLDKWNSLAPFASKQLKAPNQILPNITVRAETIEKEGG